ncbi:hypothetical protein [Pseudonocardia sp. ICBG1142]|uniref:hypothetical protein n=1 Tax=Pseudonocardia sp. ICBG1142 TaxID=2846760 RepID=UPI001CF6D11F|nr:hypothetical protein [Pseudonocardia sp. ICBG1142]
MRSGDEEKEDARQDAGPSHWNERAPLEAPPPPPYLVVAVSGTLIALVGFSSLTVVVGESQTLGERLVGACFAALAAIGLYLCRVAWHRGGFRELRTVRMREHGERLTEALARFALGLAWASKSVGGCAAFILMLICISNPPAPSEAAPPNVRITASVALVTLPLGFLIEQFVNKRPITTRVRLGLLKSRLDGVFKGAEVARKSLEDATSEIELIEREVARKFEALRLIQAP